MWGITQLLHYAQTHLQWTWSDRARRRLRRAISPSPPLRDLASRSNPVASLSSFFSQFDQIWWIFCLGFVSFMFLCLEMILYIRLEAEKMWATSRKCEQQVENVFSIVFSRAQPNTKKYFSKYFLKCHQTPENIFFSKKYFHLKIFYTWKKFYIETKTPLVWYFFFFFLN